MAFIRPDHLSSVQFCRQSTKIFDDLDVFVSLWPQDWLGGISTWACVVLIHSSFTCGASWDIVIENCLSSRPCGNVKMVGCVFSAYSPEVALIVMILILCTRLCMIVVVRSRHGLLYQRQWMESIQLPLRAVQLFLKLNTQLCCVSMRSDRCNGNVHFGVEFRFQFLAILAPVQAAPVGDRYNREPIPDEETLMRKQVSSPVSTD